MVLLEAPSGSITVPKLSSYKILELPSAISSKKPKITGIRPGEKIHEEMISHHDYENVEDLKDFYLINTYKCNVKTKLFKTHPTGYTSNLPERFLTTVELRELYNETFH